MKSWHSCIPVLVAILVACGGETGDEQTEDQPSLPPDMPDMTPTVVLETNRGRIVLELDRAAAPQTVENFLGHVRSGFYDGLTFHRVVPDFMIQAGGFTPEMGRRQSSAPDVPNEADNGLKNVRGAVAMARLDDPHSASTQFFINVTDNPRLDHRARTREGWGYAVFGHVTEGMDVVDSIATASTHVVGPHRNVPVEPIVIERAYLQGEEGNGE